MVHLNLTPPADTFDAREYKALCDEVAATLLCDARAAIQAAVTTARMTRGENWVSEGRVLLQEFGLACSGAAPMHLTA